MNLFRREKKKFPLVRQYDQADCGPAALLSVLKYYGGDDHLIHVRELCQTTSDGTTMLDLVFAAAKLGFKAKAVRGNYEVLMREKKPCIVHVLYEDRRNHYLIVYKLNESTLLLGDPGKGLTKLKRKDFEKIWTSKAIIFLKPDKELNNKVTIHWFHWILSYFRQESDWSNQSIFLGIIYTLLGLITAVLIQQLIDDLIPSKNISKIGYLGGILSLLLLIRSGAGYLRERFLVILNKRLSKSITGDFFEHLFKLPKKFFDTRKKGDITTRIHDIVRIQQAVLKISGSTIIDIFIIIGAVLMLFYFSSMIAWIIVGFLPLYVTILLLHSRPFRNMQNEVMKEFARVESVYINSLDGVDDILNFNVSESFSNTNKFIFGLFQDKIEMLGLARTRLTFITEVSGALAITTLLILSALAISQGHMKLGEMIACYSLLSYILPAVNRSVDANISLQGAFVAIRRLRDFLLAEEESDSGSKSFEMKKDLKIRRVHFSWGANKQLLQNLNMQISKGKIMSLWGSSGAGKSTLAHIIHRKYQPEQGKILLDDKAAEEISLEQYRKNIGIVSQQVKIFNGTISENIVLGRPVSSLAEQKELITRYGFANFFSRFENGLYTRIGEDGRRISDGEKQVVGLARALYDNPEILIIDEGLTALDREVEKWIFQILSQYAQDHAILINTHSLRIILKTDHLYVMKNGCIIQQGEPEKLLQSEGYFKSIFGEKNQILETLKVVS